MSDDAAFFCAHKHCESASRLQYGLGIRNTAAAYAESAGKNKHRKQYYKADLVIFQKLDDRKVAVHESV